MTCLVTSKSNILADIRNLQVSPWGSILRKKHLIMKKIICQESSTFRPIWEEKSPKAIYYESDRIYTNDYRTCYYSSGCSGEPDVLYKLPSCPKTQKIEDALVCEFNTDKVSYVTEDYRSHLITLSHDNYISLSDLETGRVMKKVFLSNIFKFRHLSWNSIGQSFFVKANNHSILRNNSAPVATFIVFEVFPLRLHSHIAVTKQAFKKSISDASIFQGLLIVMHSGNLVRLFSYDRLVEEFANVSVSLDKLSPDGIPVTVTLDDLPPILFELRCNEHNLWLGGVPLHYLYQPIYEDVYKICQLKTNQVVQKGSIPVSLDAYETDSLYFLSDDSNRLVHVTVDSAKVLKINMIDGGASRVDQLFSISPHETEEDAEDGRLDDAESVRTWQLSSFGRIIKKRVSLDLLGTVSSRIVSLQNDNDLNLMVSTSLKAEQHDLGSIDAYVCLHDDQTGKKLKTVELEEDWDDTFDHTIVLDLDTLIHTYKDNLGYCCVLYRLDRSIPDDDDEKKQPKR